MLLTTLLFPCLLKAIAVGMSPNPRVVIVSSVAHFWTKFSKAEVESDKILHKLSDKNYCTSRWGIPFFESVAVVERPLFQGHGRKILCLETSVTAISRAPC